MYHAQFQATLLKQFQHSFTKKCKLQTLSRSFSARSTAHSNTELHIWFKITDSKKTLQFSRKISEKTSMFLFLEI